MNVPADALYAAQTQRADGIDAVAIVTPNNLHAPVALAFMEQGIDATREVSELKAFAGERVNQVTYDCVQFHGGAGYMRETAVERMSRDARVMSIGGGATEVMLEEVAKRSKV